MNPNAAPRALPDLPLVNARRPLGLQRQLESQAIGGYGFEGDRVEPISIDGVLAAGVHRLPGLAILVEDSPGRRRPDLPVIPVVEEVDLRFRHRRARGEGV